MTRPLLFLFAALAWLVFSPPCFSQSWQSVVAQGSSTAGPAQVVDAAVDGSGNTIVTGNFRGTVTLGSFTLTSAGGTDFFIGRLSPTGTWLQAVRAGGTGDDSASRLVLNAFGNVWVAGGFTGSLTLGSFNLSVGSGGTLPGGLFVVCLSPAGQWLYATQGGNFNVKRMLLDSNNNIVLVGHYYDNITLGSFTLPRPTIQNIVVARLSPTATWLQTTYVGSQQYSYIEAAELDASNNVLVAGNLNTIINSSFSVNFDALRVQFPANSTTTGNALFVARFSPSGTWTQVTTVGDGVSNSGVSMALAPNGDALIATSMTAFRTVFGSFTLQNPVPTGTNYYPIVARLSAAGVWTQAQGGVGPGRGTLLYRYDGSYLVAGAFSGVYTPGLFTLTSNGGTDIFVAAVNAAGNYTHAVSAGGPYADALTCFVPLPNGQVIVAGTFSYPSATFGGLTVSTNDQTAGFVARLGGLILSGRSAKNEAFAALFPVPAHNQTMLTVATPAATERPILLLDALGHQVRRQLLPANTTTATLDLRGLAPGLYVMRCGPVSGKLVVE